jgi:ubiquinone/menaquinone biosynthesis C-methylase UbiE
MTEARLIRWRQAQVAELKWWNGWRQLPFYANHSFPEYWETVMTDVLGDFQSLAPDVVVEVGCGPHGVVRYLFEKARLKVGVDPLIRQFQERPGANAQTVYVAGVGENIPISENCADLVFCINVLDHVIDADQILREVRRILKPGGTLVLEVHTFPGLLKPFLVFDHPHTFHWTEHDVHRMAERAGFSIQKTTQRAFPIEPSWKSLLIPTHWKYVFGKRFMRLSYVRGKK